MSKPPLELTPTVPRLWVLFKEKVLPETAWERAHDLAGLYPTPSDWRRYVDRLLLALGVVFLVAGIVFFFAFNWADLHRFAKFGITQAAVLIALVLAFFLRLETWGGRLALIAACVLVGVALAVAGQAYQTGADSYRLFMIWWLVITPWVIISRWSVNWLMWAVLANTTLSLYWWQIIGGDGQLLNLILAISNFSFLLIWDFIARSQRFAFMAHDDWFRYVIALPTFSYTTFLALDWIFDFGYSLVTLGRWSPLIYVLIVGGSIVYYMTLHRDLAMLTLAALSLLVTLTAGLGRFLWEFGWLDLLGEDDWYTLSCIMGFIVIGMTAGFGYVLRELARRWEVEL